VAVPIEQRHVDSLYDRYQNVYGQPAPAPIPRSIP
jgi:L-ribulose-5-phosphate 4-epimerase